MRADAQSVTLEANTNEIIASIPGPHRHRIYDLEIFPTVVDPVAMTPGIEANEMDEFLISW